eukprot:XP_001706599.1 Hypothetical protein GL50803_29308 [Giardia lamblia ATCC 50803]
MALIIVGTTYADPTQFLEDDNLLQHNYTYSAIASARALP